MKVQPNTPLCPCHEHVDWLLLAADMHCQRRQPRQAWSEDGGFDLQLRCAPHTSKYHGLLRHADLRLCASSLRIAQEPHCCCCCTSAIAVFPSVQELRQRALARAAARAESQQGSAERQQGSAEWQQQQPAATGASPVVWGTPQYSSLWQMAMAVGEQQQQQQGASHQENLGVKEHRKFVQRQLTSFAWHCH